MLPIACYCKNDGVKLEARNFYLEDSVIRLRGRIRNHLLRNCGTTSNGCKITVIVIVGNPVADKTLIASVITVTHYGVYGPGGISTCFVPRAEIDE